jgi:hypothetical protein
MNDMEEICLASSSVIKGKDPALFMYREQPVCIGDTGLRVYSGYETQKEVYDKKHLLVCKLSELLSVDETLSKYITMAVGCACIRRKRSDDFLVIKLNPNRL